MQRKEDPSLRPARARAIAIARIHPVSGIAIIAVLALILIIAAFVSTYVSERIDTAKSANAPITPSDPLVQSAKKYFGDAGLLGVPTVQAVSRHDMDALLERRDARVEAINERLDDLHEDILRDVGSDDSDDKKSSDDSDSKESQEKSKEESEDKNQEDDKDNEKERDDSDDDDSDAQTLQVSVNEDAEDSDDKEASDKPSERSSSGTYGLSSNTTVTEGGSLTSGGNGDWWVSSGAYFHVKNGVGSTIQGKLSESDEWRERYADANSLDTDNGFHPQNIFRLVAKSTYDDVTQQAYFRINDINMSDSPNRAGHNGFLFFNRYHDQDNLYYTGIRVDGSAIIKKKKGGSYTTLSSDDVFSGAYDRDDKPNLIPEGKWIGLKSVVKDVSGGVNIKIYMDQGDGWKLISEATDTDNPVTGKSHVGVRADFMDAEFKNYRVSEN